MPEPAQSGHVRVMQTGRVQRLRQQASVELRIMTRTRDGAHVYKASYLVLPSEGVRNSFIGRVEVPDPVMTIGFDVTPGRSGVPAPSSR